MLGYDDQEDPTEVETEVGFDAIMNINRRQSETAHEYVRRLKKAVIIPWETVNANKTLVRHALRQLGGTQVSSVVRGWQENRKNRPNLWDMCKEIETMDMCFSEQSPLTRPQPTYVAAIREEAPTPTAPTPGHRPAPPKYRGKKKEIICFCCGQIHYSTTCKNWGTFYKAYIEDDFEKMGEFKCGFIRFLNFDIPKVQQYQIKAIRAANLLVWHKVNKAIGAVEPIKLTRGEDPQVHLNY